MSAIRRRPGMSRSDFSRYLQDVHGEIATRNPLELTAYVQNHVLDSVTGTAGGYGEILNDRDAIIELQFDGFPQLGATMGAEYSREVVGPDGPNFSDLPAAIAVLTADIGRQEHPQPAEAKTFNYHYAADGVELPQFLDAWRAARVEAPGTVFHEQLPEGANLLRYFGGEGVRVPSGVTSMRWDGASDPLGAAVDSVAALVGAGVPIDPRLSTTLLTREVEIFRRQP
jgi:EthD domain